MATIALTTADKLEVVKWGDAPSRDTRTAAVDITAGTYVRSDTNGNWIVALATSAANLLGSRLALRTVKAGMALTAMRSGVVAGFTISQAFNVNVFVSDTGTVADVTGTVSHIAGRVVPLYANQVDAAHDKGIEVDLPL